MFSLSLFVCAPLFFLSLSLFHCNHNTSHAYPLFTPTSKIATTVTDIPFSRYSIRVSFGFIQSVFWTEKELILYNWAFCFLPNRIKWTSKHQVHTYTSYSLNEAIRNIKKWQWLGHHFRNYHLLFFVAFDSKEKLVWGSKHRFSCGSKKKWRFLFILSPNSMESFSFAGNSLPLFISLASFSLESFYWMNAEHWIQNTTNL